ncbi:MAG: mycofactocin precursor MftA [Actinomycetota bacterium]
MDETTTDRTELDASVTEAGAAPAADVVEDELLVEEISIDGMCGVY